MTLSPGLYLDVPAAEYHRERACSNSFLGEAMASSFAQAEYNRLHPKERMGALAQGDAAHLYVLQPDLFPKRYVVAGQCEETKKVDGKRCDNPGKSMSGGGWFCGVHAKGKTLDSMTRTIISQADADMCVNIRAAVMAQPRARALLESAGPVESVAAWLDDETGVLCKARMDKVCESLGVIVDLKTTICAHPKYFWWAINHYGYHRQDAFYQTGRAKVATPCDGFAIIAVEKKPIYGCVVYEVDEEDAARGLKELRPMIDAYAKCEASGVWPGYPESVQKGRIPEWARRAIDSGTMPGFDPETQEIDDASNR